MKNNKNIINAIINIVKNPILDLKGHSTGHNRANNMGEALEEYIKRVQEILDCPISVVSVGPDRNQNIYIKEI